MYKRFFQASIIAVSVLSLNNNELNAVFPCRPDSQGYAALNAYAQTAWMASGYNIVTDASCPIVNWVSNAAGTRATATLSGTLMVGQVYHPDAPRTPIGLNNQAVTCTGHNLQHPWNSAHPNTPTINWGGCQEGLNGFFFEKAVSSYG